MSNYLKQTRLIKNISIFYLKTFKIKRSDSASHKTDIIELSCINKIKIGHKDIR